MARAQGNPNDAIHFHRARAKRTRPTPCLCYRTGARKHSVHSHAPQPYGFSISCNIWGWIGAASDVQRVRPQLSSARSTACRCGHVALP